MMELWYTAGKTFSMLCVVLGVLLTLLYALKRLTQKSNSNQEQIRLVSSFNIGPRKQILLVDVMDERLVLGVTSERINCLAQYPLKQEKKNNTSQSEGDMLTQEMTSVVGINSSNNIDYDNETLNSQVQFKQ
jgi:flagellar biosynthetic protein FliO